MTQNLNTAMPVVGSEQNNKKIKQAPKRAFTEPSAVAIVFFIIILLVLVPNTLPLFTNKASLQAVSLVFLSPLVLPGWFCAYHTGLAIAKILHKRWGKDLPAMFLTTIIAQIICIALCVGIEIAFVGYPMQMCLNSCQKIGMSDAILSYSIFSTVLFLPVYYALCRYNSWCREYNI